MLWSRVFLGFLWLGGEGRKEVRQAEV